MKYLPFEDFEIHAALTSDEVFYKLRAAVDNQRKWWIFTNKPFWGGKVERHYFSFWRVTWWNRNFTPIVSGKTQSASSGCHLQIKMRMPLFAFLFYSFWLGAVWVLYFGGISNLVIKKVQTGIWQIDSPWLLLPIIGMFAFGYLLSVGTFMSEAHRIKEFLMELSRTSEENITCKDQIFGITESQIIKTLLLVTIIAWLGWIAYSLLW